MREKKRDARINSISIKMIVLFVVILVCNFLLLKINTEISFILIISFLFWFSHITSKKCIKTSSSMAPKFECRNFHCVEHFVTDLVFPCPNNHQTKSILNPKPIQKQKLHLNRIENRFSYFQTNWRKSVKNTSTECMNVRATNGI